MIYTSKVTKSSSQISRQTNQIIFKTMHNLKNSIIKCFRQIKNGTILIVFKLVHLSIFIPPANEVAGVYSDPYVRPFFTNCDILVCFGTYWTNQNYSDKPQSLRVLLIMLIHLDWNINHTPSIWKEVYIISNKFFPVYHRQFFVSTYHSRFDKNFSWVST